jgi:signal transduction histidine kinase
VSIVMLTGFGSLETAQKAMRLGANDYIRKPFETKEMREAVRRYAERTKIARKKAGAIEELTRINERMEGEMARREHLASLGLASSELVHDLRNPLTVISGYVQILIDELSEIRQTDADHASELLRYLERIERSVKRCREMSEIWRDLGKKDPSRMKPASVADLVADAVETSEPLAEQAGGTVEIAGGPADCRVLADEVQVFRSLQNLIGNAIQAFPVQGGRVDVSWAVCGDWVEIRISDNGAGIREGELDKIFDLAFTTKQDSGGMGIGLFISKKVAEAHGGSLRLANNPDKGAVATMQLPVLR